MVSIWGVLLDRLLQQNFVNKISTNHTLGGLFLSLHNNDGSDPKP